MLGVKFGFRRSTIWYAQRLKYLISIEDNQDFFTRVEVDLKTEIRTIINLEIIFKYD